ncbi:hypothetical protein J437_LFUL013343 [Ladona fulva]|uniref:BING4 C-terminal domain-containing protein n=1 Tax=Ladona fulva TaxID=123851 RepID=A0A8K0KJP0_LADFU|nr:hypothetical protein J437_LFUL013343 [Ladona fulva]
MRNFGALQRYRLNYPPSDIAFSQKGLLAAGNGNVFQDCATKTADKPYIRHNPRGALSQLEFCPFEDVLGVTTRVGFESLLIPGIS